MILKKKHTTPSNCLVAFFGMPICRTSSLRRWFSSTKDLRMKNRGLFRIHPDFLRFLTWLILEVEILRKESRCFLRFSLHDGLISTFQRNEWSLWSFTYHMKELTPTPRSKILWIQNMCCPWQLNQKMRKISEKKMTIDTRALVENSLTPRALKPKTFEVLKEHMSFPNKPPFHRCGICMLTRRW